MTGQSPAKPWQQNLQASSSAPATSSLLASSSASSSSVGPGSGEPSGPRRFEAPSFRDAQTDAGSAHTHSSTYPQYGYGGTHTQGGYAPSRDPYGTRTWYGNASNSSFSSPYASSGYYGNANARYAAGSDLLYQDPYNAHNYRGLLWQDQPMGPQGDSMRMDLGPGSLVDQAVHEGRSWINDVQAIVRTFAKLSRLVEMNCDAMHVSLTSFLRLKQHMQDLQSEGTGTMRSFSLFRFLEDLLRSSLGLAPLDSLPQNPPSATASSTSSSLSSAPNASSEPSLFSLGLGILFFFYGGWHILQWFRAGLRRNSVLPVDPKVSPST